MDASTTAKRTRTEQCKINAQARSAKKRQAAFDALARLQLEGRAITKAAVARRAGVSEPPNGPHVLPLLTVIRCCAALSAVCRARYASPPVRVERDRSCEVKAVQVAGSGVGARSSE
jgi:hypothetical protein